MQLYTVKCPQQHINESTLHCPQNLFPGSKK
jgi:hypothetical protein